MRQRLIRDHWYRAPQAGHPCVFRQDGPCGQPREAHVQAVGEWLDAAHWYRLNLRRPTRCARCGHVPSHGVHHFTRRRRRLYGWTVR